MGNRATSKTVRVSTRKVRLVADMVRNIQAIKALDMLSLTQKRGSTPIAKTIKSALANALSNAKVQREKLFVKSIDVLEGQAIKRFHPSTRGRVHPYKRRTSHITVILEERA